jgi:hypothetical protein
VLPQPAFVTEAPRLQDPATQVVIEEIVGFLRRSGWSSQEIAFVLPHLPRWERHLRNMGVTVIPGAQAYWSDDEDRAHDHLFHLMMNAGSGTPEWIKHRQRDITGVRRPGAQ